MLNILLGGEYSEGFKAYAIAIQNGLKVDELRRVYRVESGKLVGPTWHMTFHH